MINNSDARNEINSTTEVLTYHAPDCEAVILILIINSTLIALLSVAMAQTIGTLLSANDGDTADHAVLQPVLLLM